MVSWPGWVNGDLLQMIEFTQVGQNHPFARFQATFDLDPVEVSKPYCHLPSLGYVISLHYVYVLSALTLERRTVGHAHRLRAAIGDNKKPLLSDLDEAKRDDYRRG